MTALVPKIVLVPFEWRNDGWVKRDDLPRFADIELVAPYMAQHPEIHYRNGTPVPITWIECDRSDFIREYLRGVGTPEWLSLQKN